MAADPPAAPIDLAYERSLQEPRDGCEMWVTKNDFNAAIKVSFAAQHRIVRNRGYKNTDNDNNYRITQLIDNPNKQRAQWAPPRYQDD